jgi:hypothetical protein
LKHPQTHSTNVLQRPVEFAVKSGPSIHSTPLVALNLPHTYLIPPDQGALAGGVHERGQVAGHAWVYARSR